MKDEYLEYLDKLKEEPFEGWNEDAKQGYLTALVSAKEKYKSLFKSHYLDFYYTLSPPVMIEDVASVIEAMQHEGWEFVTLVPAGAVPAGAVPVKAVMVFCMIFRTPHSWDDPKPPVLPNLDISDVRKRKTPQEKALEK